jgi:beta-lactamase class A
LSRRQTISGLSALTLLGLTGRARAIDPPAQQVATIEKKIGGRAGVYVRDATGRVLIAHNADERFPMCSTHKFLAAAAALKRVDQGSMTLEQIVPYGEADLLSYAPVAKANVAKGGLALGKLCEAAVTVSDNTAANLILRMLGGPQGLTAYAHSLGDNDTRLDRLEPDLNSAIPGDPRDTTTPHAIGEDLWRILVGNALTTASQQLLENWMIASKTGLKRLRAGLPGDWLIGDKTGSGANATANTIAIIRPPGRAPLFAAVYLTGSQADADDLDHAHVDVARIIVDVVLKS